MCPSNILSQQLQHSAALAALLMALATIALLLDLFSRKLEQLGATAETADAVRKAALMLLCIDLVFLVAYAILHLVVALRCMVGL